MELGFQGWITYNLRFILDGDLCGAWDTFGGLSAQITENATIAQTYDSKIRTYAQELSKFRQREKDIIDLLMDEDQRIKRDTLRGCGATQSFSKKGKYTKDSYDKPPRGRDKRKGKRKRATKEMGKASDENGGSKTTTTATVGDRRTSTKAGTPTIGRIYPMTRRSRMAARRPLRPPRKRRKRNEINIILHVILVS